MLSRRLLIVAVIAVFSSAAQAPADWTATAPLPDTYTAHAMVHTGGYLYHFGGLAGFDGLFSGDKVFYAQVTGPGTIAAWVETTTALPALSFFHAAAAWDDKLYVLGGQHWDGAGLVVASNVYYSQIGNNGVPGAWQTMTPLPEPLYLHSVVVWNGRIYVTGGWTDAGLSNRVYSAEVNPDGTLGSWVSLLNLPEAIYTHAAVVANGRVYVLGGVINNGNDLHNAVYMSLIQGDGSLGPWVTTTPLPEPLSDHEAVIIGGRVYVLGGWIGAAPTTAVRSAEILPDKTLGAWQSEPSLPVPLYLHGGATDGDAIFSSGGSDSVDPHNEVYALPVAPPASPADLTGPRDGPDGWVDAFDLGAMLGAWCSGVNDPNPPSPPCENCTPANLAVADISGAANVPDGCVDAFDLAKLLAEWCSVAGGNPCGTCFP
ncbi:MAG: hypothetical protein O7C65_07940 [Planctomycetota bacterium]|nr:hypothetical protein [Planctomycetota bacterium]